MIFFFSLEFGRGGGGGAGEGVSLAQSRSIKLLGLKWHLVTPTQGGLNRIIQLC